MLIDQQFHRGRQAYTVHQIHHLDGHVLRVQVERDHYEIQSHATVDVLTPQLTWTPLTFTSADTWHARTPIDSTTAAPLLPIASNLAERAQRILAPMADATTEPPAPSPRPATPRRRSPSRGEATS